MYELKPKDPINEAGIAHSVYGLDGRVSISERVIDFCLLRGMNPGSGAH
jgi:hypothetical protein